LAALFISLGYYNSLINRLSSAYQKRAKLITDAAVRYLPEVRFTPPSGGSALWLRAPEGTDMSTARERAMQRGVLFDAGEDFFSTASPPKNFFRLGFSSIEDENIEPGIIALAQELKL
jgi:GntR family transcriptional regulator/MocR family aminotransferase